MALVVLSEDFAALYPPKLGRLSVPSVRRLRAMLLQASVTTPASASQHGFPISPGETIPSQLQLNPGAAKHLVFPKVSTPRIPQSGPNDTPLAR